MAQNTVPNVAPVSPNPTIQDAEDAEDLEWEMIKIPDNWIPNPENPDAAKDNMLRHYRALEEHYTRRGYKTRFQLWSEDGETQGFHAIQRPLPDSRNDKSIEQELVYMIKTKEDGQEEYKLFPLAEVDQQTAEGWELWHPEEPRVDKEGRDPRPCNRPEDTREKDQPHLDFERYFTKDAVEFVKEQCAPPNWQTHEPLEHKETYKEEDNISTAKKFRPPSEWDNLVSGSSGGHLRKIQLPRDIGAGWGDYHLFDQWQSYGRQVTADMVENKEWSTQLDEITFVSADDPTETLTIPIGDDIKKSATYQLGDAPPKPLREHLLAKKGKRN
ncbi:hypothetical protein EV127DRAFT_480109 [Xylaria flabelliformis]|nr:hypothetical protein EV127DRAFT_480109 [Xylaria flabelliformis]